MTPIFAFTQPSAAITTARTALARLQRHLDHVADPAHDGADSTCLAFAVMTLEAIHPPYPPLPDDVGECVDPPRELAAAIAGLLEASERADTAQEVLRYAYVLRELRHLEGSPHLLGPAGDARDGRA